MPVIIHWLLNNPEKRNRVLNVIDMHCDTIAELWYSRKTENPIALDKNSLHIDLAKMKQGDYLLQNFAMFVSLGRPMDPLESVLQLIDIFYQEMEKNTDKIGVVTTYKDIENNKAAGRMSALLSIEEGGVCKGNLSYLRTLYRLGVRMMTLTWNYENELAYPNTVSGDAAILYPTNADTDHGLKKQGFVFLEEMERMGMIIDVSHLSDAGFYDVYHHTTKPFVASHSNARAICGHCRNLSDDMIRKLAERGGVTGINYCADFLMEQTKKDEAIKSTVKQMAEHAKHLAKIGGIGCVGLGSDFDGISGDLELSDCSKLPLLEAELRKQGFHESEIEAIFFGNVLRLYKELL